MRDKLKKELHKLEQEHIDLEARLTRTRRSIKEIKTKLGEKTDQQLVDMLRNTTWILDVDQYLKAMGEEVIDAAEVGQHALIDAALGDFLEGFGEDIVNCEVSSRDGVEIELADGPYIQSFDMENFGFNATDLLKILYTLDLLACMRINVLISPAYQRIAIDTLEQARNGINRILRIVRSGKFFKKDK